MQGLSAQKVISNSTGQKRLTVDLGTPIDSSRYEMIYALQMRDPVVNDIKEEIRILQIGNNAIADGGYKRFRIDSVLWKKHEPAATMQELSLIREGFGNIPGPEGMTSYVYQDGKWRESDMIGFSGFCAYDSAAHQDWQLFDEEKVVAGVNCKKATTHFRGRDWIVWYAPEIPYPAGPWKLGGLPGLILKASSSDGEYKIQAFQLRHGSDVIRKFHNHYKAISREEFRKRYQEDNEYPFRTAFWNQNGRHERYDERQFYNPIEKTLD